MFQDALGNAPQHTGDFPSPVVRVLTARISTRNRPSWIHIFARRLWPEPIASWVSYKIIAHVYFKLYYGLTAQGFLSTVGNSYRPQNKSASERNTIVALLLRSILRVSNPQGTV